MAQDERPPKFNMIWRNLDRALSMPVFSKHEVAVMQVARELSYTSSVVDGTGRARPFKIHAARLAERRDLVRETVSRSVAELMADNVLSGTRDRLRIVKDYRLWRNKHALTERQIRECDDATETPVTTCGEVLPLAPDGGDDPSTDDEKSCDYFVTDPVTISSQGPADPVTISSQVVTISSQGCDEIVTGHIGTRPSDRVKTEQSSNDDAGATADTPPEYDHQGCVELALDLLGDKAAALVAKKRQDVEANLLGDFDCYAAAIKAAHRRQCREGQDAIKDLGAFLVKMTRTYLDEGIPDEPVSVPPKAAPAASARVPRPDEQVVVAPPGFSRRRPTSPPKES